MKSSQRPKLQALKLAIEQLRDLEQKVTITAVAGLVGVTPPLIHNTYPEIARQVRNLNGKSAEAKRNEAARKLAALRQANEVLRGERDSALADNRKLASMNESLRFEVARLQGLADGFVKPIKGSNHDG